MFYEGIDTLFLAVEDLEITAAVYQRLGLRLSPVAEHGVQGRSFLVGTPTAFVTTQLLDGGPVDQGDHPLSPHLRKAAAAGRGLFAVGLRVQNLAEVVRELAGRGVESVAAPIRAADGKALASMAWLPLHDQAATDLVLLEGRASSADLYSQALAANGGNHSLPLKRLDHLAAVAHDLEAKTRFWVEVLGVPLAGEVRTPTLIVRQFRIGDAVMELLGAASADSPIHQRAPGLVSLASWEVADLECVTQQVRAAGFSPSDPGTGALPGTRTATIAAPEVGGMSMQLLQYV